MSGSLTAPTADSFEEWSQAMICSRCIIYYLLIYLSARKKNSASVEGPLKKHTELTICVVRCNIPFHTEITHFTRPSLKEHTIEALQMLK